MKRVKANIYNKDVEPKNGVSNAYKVRPHSIKHPCNMVVSGTRNSGKSFLISKIIAQAMKDKVFDEIYIVTPTMLSNRAYFGSFIPDQNVFEPTGDCLQSVLDTAGLVRDEWEQFQRELKDYNEYMETLKGKNDFTDDQLWRFDELGFLDGIPDRPVWKYPKEREPQFCCILDDILGSPCIMKSRALSTMATLNRHLFQINDEYVLPGGRTACGMSIIIATQSYSCQNGVPRLLRENTTMLILVGAMKHEKQMEKIAEELSGNIDAQEFLQAHRFATKKRYGSLAIDFFADCPTQTFRMNLNEYLVFPSQEKECTCKIKPKKMVRVPIEENKEEENKEDKK